MEESPQMITLNAASTPLQQDALAGKVWRHRTLLPRERLAAAGEDAVALMKYMTEGVAPLPCSRVVALYSAASSAKWLPRDADEARGGLVLT
jgi:hypothetical protein